MHQGKYIDRTYSKYEKVLDYYARLIFETVETAEEVYALSTYEHFRVPPKYEEMERIQPHTAWGGEYANMWLRFSYHVPDALEGEQLGVIPDVDAAEILCFKNGKPVGIINSKNNFIGGNHSVMFLSEKATGGEKIEVALECYAGHGELGCSPYSNYDADENMVWDLRKEYTGVRIVKINRQMRDFVFDVMTVVQLAKLPKPNSAALKAHECLMKAFPYMIFDPASAAKDELDRTAEVVCEILAPALEKSRGNRSRGKIGVIGHSHMDTAWLWPVSETIRKCARTFSQVLTLMDMYPEYKFIQSSALHLDWMREYYPDIFEGIRKRVAEGRYEPNGGVWVECDCNITGGESMVRQFLMGQRYTRKHFGYTSDAFWLPDTFGYNAAIPQIMQKSGVKYFYTTKIGWNDLNRFPADSFVWRGIDGSEVITHFNQVHFTPDVSTLAGMVPGLQDQYGADMRLAAFGYGDGGGGPTYGMCELLKREADLDGMPEIESTTISAFMQELEERRDKLPLFDGELYFELHRGTLTQMHTIKKNNRLGEIALHDMELWNVLSGEKTNEKTDELYKVLLKNQFHDILPGTAIPKVYELCIPEMEEMIATARTETMSYAKRFSEGGKEKLSVFNPLSFERDDIAVIEGEWGLEGADCQTYVDFDGKERTAVKITVPAFSSVTLNRKKPGGQESRFVFGGNRLTTPLYEVCFDENGYISSLYDLRCAREVKREGAEALGTLYIGEDMPQDWDNWDINDDVYRTLKPVRKLVSREVISDGAVEFRIRCQYKIGRNSGMTVDMVFYAENPRIDYEMKVDWKERHMLLKMGFDVAIRSAFIKSEIQFGHVDRPTTRNNSYEDAKFEVCNHKWSDLSETHYGVALLNDCKYGISAEGSNMMLTLHKGGCRPDPFTDIGVHTMTCALLPHPGAFDAKTVVHPAYELNYKALPVEGELHVPELFELTNSGIICEAVKNAEEAEGAYVLRLYEAERNHSTCVLTVKEGQRAYLTNMLEEKEEELPMSGNQITLRFRPFEIKTILIER